MVNKMNKSRELRPDRLLLHPNFVGYKLSLDPVPIHTLQLNCAVDIVVPSNEQYSFLHMKQFTLHNHLVGDPWLANIVYYVDENWKIQRCVFDDLFGRFEDPQEVWEIPCHHIRGPEHYNVSLSFPSPDLVVVTDGAGTLHIVSSVRRDGDQNWLVQFSEEVVGKEVPFVLADSRVVENENSVKLLHCILSRIQISETEDSAQKHSVRSATVLDWLTLGQESNCSWSVISSQKLKGNTSSHYTALEPTCQALYLASDKPFKFITNVGIDLKGILEGNGDKVVGFAWHQSEFSVKLYFNLMPGSLKECITVTCLDYHITVKYEESLLLAGSLCHPVDAQLTTWTFDNDRLEVLMMKSEVGQLWHSVTNDKNIGHEVVDDELVDKVHKHLFHLCSNPDEDLQVQNVETPTFNIHQLEDCDDFAEESKLIVRFDLTTHSATHQVTLGGLQWVLNVRVCPDLAPAFCLRHDVDACVWQPDSVSPLSQDIWPCTHTGTLLAFGYVQASKQQRKFTVCAPDLSYVAICEVSRRIYLYRQSNSVDGDLHNRKSGKCVKSVAIQQLINLDSAAPIIGAHATKTQLFVLTSQTLFAIQVG